jgi:CRISPR-associated protein Cas1
MHGKTRRGALVFDVADLIKDAIVLPWAFVGARRELDEQAFRAQILQSFISYKAMDRMIETIEDVLDTLGVAP